MPTQRKMTVTDNKFLNFSLIVNQRDVDLRSSASFWRRESKNVPPQIPTPPTRDVRNKLALQ